jgi:zinc protease
MRASLLRFPAVIIAACAMLLTGPATAQRAAAPRMDRDVQALVDRITIPYERFELDNGLTVIVHTDRKAPVVAVSMWYDVGSKHEPAGSTGFAHLFEHIMFNGSENAPGDYFTWMQDIGATDLNGTTNPDRTNYFQTVPTGALERTLWLEADRMGNLLGAVTQQTLDNQRGVVQNEKRQGDNQPFGLLRYYIFENLTPRGHPYHHSTIGSMADLNSASLDRVQSWFRDHYAPNNAVIVLAGDIDAATARPMVERYFGGFARGREVVHPEVSIPTLRAR